MHGPALEAGAAEIATQQQAKDALIDLSEVERMDTAGAWVIDRARFALSEAGVPAAYRGARSEYALLLKDAGYRPVEARKRVHTAQAVTLLASIGEATFGAWSDLKD